MTKPTARAEVKRRIKAIHQALTEGAAPPNKGIGKCRAALVVAAERLGISVPALRNSLTVGGRAYGLKVDWARWKQPKEVKAGNGLPAQSVRDRVAQRQADQLQALREELRKAHRELNAGDDLRQAVFGLKAQEVSPPRWMIEPAKARTSPGIPILFTSDFQWGEKVSAREMDGISEFNVAIAGKRYRRLIAKTIELSFSHMVKPVYPGLIYLRGGDMISGDIHQELRETNDLQSIPAVRSLVEHEVAGLEALLKHFPKIRVISVPGNHGRTTIKPFAKRYVETNYDTLSAWMIEQWFQARGETRISFWTPDSGDALFDLYGYWFLLTHGDRIGSRGGQGFIGPAATIARGHKRLRDYYAELGTLIDYILNGHFHTRLELEYGFANGSLPGPTEYSRDGRMTPKQPEQWLLFVHPDRGVTARWPIMLENRPRLAANVQRNQPFGAVA